jgi:hypothetical protein
MAADQPYKHTMPSLETPPFQPTTHDAPGVRVECSDRQLGTSEGLLSSSQQRRYRRESDSAVALTWCVLASVAALAIAAGMAT